MQRHAGQAQGGPSPGHCTHCTDAGSSTARPTPAAQPRTCSVSSCSVLLSSAMDFRSWTNSMASCTRICRGGTRGHAGVAVGWGCMRSAAGSACDNNTSVDSSAASPGNAQQAGRRAVMQAGDQHAQAGGDGRMPPWPACRLANEQRAGARAGGLTSMMREARLRGSTAYTGALSNTESRPCSERAARAR